MKTIIINANNFSDLEGFFNEIDAVMTSDLDFKTGHNLNAFRDILIGGFGIHEYEEKINLVWQNSAKSKADLNELWDDQKQYDALVEIIKSYIHITFVEK